MAERVNKGMVKCIDCRHGEYMQWFENPLICKCTMHNERYVAEARHLCEEFVKRTTKVEFTHYDHY